MPHIQVGKTVPSKYRGECSRTGEFYEPGDPITRDDFGYFKAGAADPGGSVALTGGSGNGDKAWYIGQQIVSDGVALVITRAARTYYRTNGHKFGVGAVSGYRYTALAKPVADAQVNDG